MAKLNGLVYIVYYKIDMGGVATDLELNRDTRQDRHKFIDVQNLQKQIFFFITQNLSFSAAKNQQLWEYVARSVIRFLHSTQFKNQF